MSVRTFAYLCFYALFPVCAAALATIYLNDGEPTIITFWLSILSMPLFILGFPGVIIRHTSLFDPPAQPPATPSIDDTLALVRAEALRARAKYPEHPENTHHDWLRAAAEELGKCSRTIHNGGMTQAEMNQLRAEVIQLSATALNWAECARFSPTEEGDRA